MLVSVREFVNSAFNRAGDVQQQALGVQMAAAALLVEIAAADFEQQPEEREAIAAAIKDAFDLEANDIEQLINDAEQHHAEAISLHEYTRVLNEQCSHQQKFEILTQLWRIAFADGQLDKYEDHRIRRIADLLYLSHSEFIKAKHLAEK